LAKVSGLRSAGYYALADQVEQEARRRNPGGRDE
jgi:hypothetical protein